MAALLDPSVLSRGQLDVVVVAGSHRQVDLNVARATHPPDLYDLRRGGLSETSKGCLLGRGENPVIIHPLSLAQNSGTERTGYLTNEESAPDDDEAHMRRREQTPVGAPRPGGLGQGHR